MNLKNIIGKKETFAIEYEVINILKPFVYGKFCYWIDGKQVGDYENGVTLSDILGLLPSIVQDNGKRYHEELFHLELKELFSRITKALSYENEYSEQAQMEQWRRFDIGICVDILYDYIIYLVESGDRARIIVFTSKKQLLEAYIKKGLFDKVSMQFYVELNRIYNTLIDN